MEPHATVSDYVVSWTDANLTHGVTYRYAVLAYNEVGDGPLGQVVGVTPVGDPGAPTDISVEAGDGYVLLGWERPEDTGGFPIERFLIYRGASHTDLAHHVDVDGGRPCTTTPAWRTV